MTLPELSAAATQETAVMVCPQCEGEGGYPDGLDEAACHTDCTRCLGNGWIVDVAALSRTGQLVERDGVAGVGLLANLRDAVFLAAEFNPTKSIRDFANQSPDFEAASKFLHSNQHAALTAITGRNEVAQGGDGHADG